MKDIEVSIKVFKEKQKEHLQKYCDYLQELRAINQAENAEIDKMPGSNSREQYDNYEKQCKDKILEFNKQRKDLKEKYKEFSDMYSCPYYCVIKDIKSLDKMQEQDDPNYEHYKEKLKTYKGKILEDYFHPERYGKFIGLAFFLDEVYYLIENKETHKQDFLLNAKLH